MANMGIVLILVVSVAVVIQQSCVTGVPANSRKTREVNGTGSVADFLALQIATTAATTAALLSSLPTTSTTTSTTSTTSTTVSTPTSATNSAVAFPTFATAASEYTGTIVLPPSPTPVVLAVVEDLRGPVGSASEHIIALSPVPSGPPELDETSVIDAIQKGLTKLRTSGDRLKKFVEKIEAGIQTGAISKTIEDVKTKIESGKVDLHKLVAAYKQKSPLTFDELIKRISEDSHVLLDKLHGKIESLSLLNSEIPLAHEKLEEADVATAAASDDHPHVLPHPDKDQIVHTTSIPSAALAAAAVAAPNSATTTTTTTA